jgi:hypothetical protein
MCAPVIQLVFACDPHRMDNRHVLCNNELFRKKPLIAAGTLPSTAAITIAISIGRGKRFAPVILAQAIP